MKEAKDWIPVFEGIPLTGQTRKLSLEVFGRQRYTVSPLFTASCKIFTIFSSGTKALWDLARLWEGTQTASAASRKGSCPKQRVSAERENDGWIHRMLLNITAKNTGVVITHWAL